MKKIILVPHTHWDREWYFTDQTSAILLNRLKTDITNNKNKFPFILDGQASLVDDMIDNNIESFLSKNMIIAGPLYIQQDTYNVLFGTTINNIELGKKVLGKSVPKTVYMPDTFGFNEQLPQIFKHYGFENFVNWRGLKPEDVKDSNAYMWEGHDGTRILSSTMADGYYCMGQHYPYNKEKDYEHFIAELLKHIKLLEQRSEQEIYWVPLGGDQAPYEIDVLNAINLFNSKQDEYELSVGTHDDYFNQLKNTDSLPVLKHRLDYSGVSKIHRTIHSNRYDIKKSFRDAEIKTYYQMELLEAFYKKMGGQLIEESDIDKYVYKQILKSSAHDSLGGCNSDETNNIIISRNKSVISYVDSYIDMMLRDIKENVKLDKNQYLVINASPFLRDVSYRDIISTNNEKQLCSQTQEIVEYDFENISFKEHLPVFNHFISVHVKKMEPWSYKVIEINTNKSMTDYNMPKNKLPFMIKIEEDTGDEFDFSYGDIKNTILINDFTFVKSLGFEYHKVTCYKIQEINASIYAFEFEGSTEYNLIIDNKLKDKKLSLQFEKHGKTSLSRHLAFIEQHMDNIPNWKEEGYKDKPINFFAQDGLIINGKQNILTKGNNEVFLGEHIELTLFRSVSLMGKPNLNTRPGSASGLPMRVKTTGSQMQGIHNFDFCINKSDPTKSLNEWNLGGLGIFSENDNPTLNKVGRFVINKKELNTHVDKLKTLDITNVLLGRFKQSSERINIAYTKPNTDRKGTIIYEDYKI